MNAHDDIVYGMHAVNAILESHPERVVQLWIQQGRQDQRMQDIIMQASTVGIAYKTVPADTLDKHVKGVHQGVIAWVKHVAPVIQNLDQLFAQLKSPPFLLILEGMTDPHNLGACLRTAEAAGVHAVVVPKHRSVLLTPAVKKVACGAAERVPFITVNNLAHTLRELKELGIWTVGLTLNDRSRSLYQAQLKGPVALVLGSEGEGLRSLTEKLCDECVYIPMQGQIESLNVSVAAGIAMFEKVRQG